MSAYIIEHEGKQYTPDGQVTVESATEHNQRIEQAELAHWQTKPERMLAYVTRNLHGVLVLTNWLGTSLGVVTGHSEYRNNLTGTRTTHVRVRGNNGARYHGAYGSDWSQAVCLRRTKA